jgi:DNA-directed RNA polymerase specialized sigma24 family protein
VTTTPEPPGKLDTPPHAAVVNGPEGEILDCIDQLRSGRVRRESYVGERLPEPLVDDGRSDPADHAEVADSLSLAFPVLLESLTPEQRAAFLLREVFD